MLRNIPNEKAFIQSIKSLQNADGLIIVGSTDKAYNASKLYPYILAKRPLLTIFNPLGGAASLIKDFNIENLNPLNTNTEETFNLLFRYLKNVEDKKDPIINWESFEKHTAKFLTNSQVNLFNKVLECYKIKS